MIKATFFKDSDNNYRGFSLLGHAGYGNVGEDIVCAAVSALTLNTANSIEALTSDKDKMNVVVDEVTGMLTCSFTGIIGKESTLLVDSLILGLEGIKDGYSDKTYIKISIKEV